MSVSAYAPSRVRALSEPDPAIDRGPQLRRRRLLPSIDFRSLRHSKGDGRLWGDCGFTRRSAPPPATGPLLLACRPLDDSGGLEPKRSQPLARPMRRVKSRGTAAAVCCLRPEGVGKLKIGPRFSAQGVPDTVSLLQCLGCLRRERIRRWMCRVGRRSPLSLSRPALALAPKRATAAGPLGCIDAAAPESIDCREFRWTAVIRSK